MAIDDTLKLAASVVYRNGIKTDRQEFHVTKTQREYYSGKILCRVKFNHRSFHSGIRIIHSDSYPLTTSAVFTRRNSLSIINTHAHDIMYYGCVLFLNRSKDRPPAEFFFLESVNLPNPSRYCVLMIWLRVDFKYESSINIYKRERNMRNIFYVVLIHHPTDQTIEWSS